MMLDIKAVIADTKANIAMLKHNKDALMIYIKKGNMALYPKYLDICTDMLTLQSQLHNLYKSEI